MSVSCVLSGFLLASIAASIAVLAWPWKVDASAKALGSPSSLSIAGGLELLGFSASVAAIVGGPGVVAVHLRGRQLFKRAFSIDTILAWLNRPKKDEGPPGRFARVKKRVADWAVARTDLADLPELGLRLLGDLAGVSLHGKIACGFKSARRMGKAATWLYPIAGVVAPLGTLEIDLDWSGKDHVDGEGELSFRFVLAKIARQCLWFVWHHFHPLRRLPSISAHPPAHTTT